MMISKVIRRNPNRILLQNKFYNKRFQSTNSNSNSTNNSSSNLTNKFIWKPAKYVALGGASMVFGITAFITVEFLQFDFDAFILIFILIFNIFIDHIRTRCYDM